MHRIFLLLTTAGCVIALLFWTQWEWMQSRRQVTSLQTRLDSTLVAIDSLRATNESFLTLYKIRAQAEELFFAGQVSEALKLYQQYDQVAAQLGKPKITVQRAQLAHTLAQQVQNLDSLRLITAALVQERMELHARIQKTQALLAERVDPAPLMAHLRAQEDSLRTLDALLEAQRADLQRALDRFEPIRFKSAKGQMVVYMGDKLNGKAHGFGVGVWTTGGIYVGEWRDGYRHGKGRHEWPDGESYEGEYVADYRTGQGTYKWSNGKVFTGRWVKDLRDGAGVLYDHKGVEQLRGVWVKDQFTKRTKPSPDSASTNGSIELPMPETIEDMSVPKYHLPVLPNGGMVEPQMTEE